jgi:cytoskeletal protein CcmA (bactofilin family)
MSEMETRETMLPARRPDEMPLTVVSEGDVVIGRLHMCGNGQLLGSLDGHVSCQGELLVGPGARVRADIEAHDLILGGQVQGNVVVRGRLKITTTGRLEGDAQVGSLMVQEGGVHFGVLHVHPEGLPEDPPASLVPVVAEASPPAARSGGAILAASVDRVKRMWREIF